MCVEMSASLVFHFDTLVYMSVSRTVWLILFLHERTYCHMDTQEFSIRKEVTGKVNRSGVSEGAHGALDYKTL